jgi:transcriptional regulator with XRE-family HTH domain
MAACKKDPTAPKGSRAITVETPPELLGLPGRAEAERKKRGWTQDELAQKAGVSQATISNLEKNKSLKGVRLVSAYRVAKIFDMTLDEFALGMVDPWVSITEAIRRGKISPHDVAPAELGSVPAPAPETESASKPEKTNPPQS